MVVVVVVVVVVVAAAAGVPNHRDQQWPVALWLPRRNKWLRQTEDGA